MKTKSLVVGRPAFKPAPADEGFEKVSGRAAGLILGTIRKPDPAGLHVKA